MDLGGTQERQEARSEENSFAPASIAGSRLAQTAWLDEISGGLSWAATSVTRCEERARKSENAFMFDQTALPSLITRTTPVEKEINMKDDDTYNGWKNKETWHINLADLDDVFIEMAQRQIAEGGSQYELRDEIQNWVTSIVLDEVELDRTILESDLLQCALHRVDWFRLAEASWEEAEALSRAQ